LKFKRSAPLVCRLLNSSYSPGSRVRFDIALLLAPSRRDLAGPFGVPILKVLRARVLADGDCRTAATRCDPVSSPFTSLIFPLSKKVILSSSGRTLDSSSRGLLGLGDDVFPKSTRLCHAYTFLFSPVVEYSAFLVSLDDNVLISVALVHLPFGSRQRR